MHAGGKGRIGSAVASSRAEKERETDRRYSAYTEVRVEEGPTDQVGAVSGRVRTRQGWRGRWRWGKGGLKMEEGIGEMG